MLMIALYRFFYICFLMLEMLYFLNKISKTNNVLYHFIQLVIDEKS